MKNFVFFILIASFSLPFTKFAFSESSLQSEITADKWALERLIEAEKRLSELEGQRSKYTGQDLPPPQEELILEIQYELARRYYEMGNFKEAFSFLMKAPGGGFAPARFSLYRMFFLGEKINQDIQEAFSLLAEKSGPGVRSAFKDWTRWLRVAADQGLLIALHYKALEHLKTGCFIEMNGDLNGDSQYQIRVKEECFKKAISYFELPAEQGFAPSLYYMALMYLRAEGAEKNSDKILQLLEVAADQGFAPAQEMLEQGWDEDQQAQSELFIYEYEESHRLVFLNLPKSQVMESLLEGIDLDTLNLERVEPGFKEPGYKALEQTERNWIKIASEDKGESDSIKETLEEDLNEVQYRTLITHTWGNANPWRALKKLRRKAYLGYHLDQYDLALIHYKGDGIEKNIEMAFYWFAQAADRGSAPAEYALAFLLEELAEAEEPGSKLREYLLDRSLERLIKSAEQAYAPAQYKLAHEYEEENPELAFQLLEAAADQDYLSALYEMYFKFLEKGDYQSAIFSLTKASKQGLLFAKYELAHEYKKENPKRALQLWKEVAEQGLTLAYYSLYLEYLEREDYKQAISFLQEASKQGLPLAQYALADEYDKGERGEKDNKWAVYWFIEAAKQDYAPAQYKLYFKFTFDEGAYSNTEVALHWLERSAAQGHAPAQYQLAVLYDEGRVADKGINEAVHLFIEAEKQNHEPALLWLIDVVCGNYKVEEKIFNIAMDWLKERKKEEILNQCSDHLYKKGLVIGSVGLFAAAGAEQAYAQEYESTTEVVSHIEEESAVHPGESTSEVSAVSDSQISEATVKSTSQTVFEESAEALPHTAEAASELSAEMVTKVGASIVGEIAADLALDWIPIVGFGKLGFEAIIGVHLLTGRNLSPFDRAASGGGAILNLVGLGWLKNLKSLKHSKAVGQQAKKWAPNIINGEQWAKFVHFVKEGQIERARGYLKSVFQSIGDIGFKIKRRVTTRKKVLAGGGTTVDEVSETVVVNMEEGLGVPGRLEPGKLSRAVDPDKMSNPGQSKVYRTSNVDTVPAASHGVFVRTPKGDQPLDYSNPEVLRWLRQTEAPQRQSLESVIGRGSGETVGKGLGTSSLIPKGLKETAENADIDFVLY